jgi:hypothetical protein
MVMKQLHRLGPHKVRGDLRHRRLEDHVSEFSNPFPVAIVIKEPPAIARFQIFGGIRPGLGHVDLYPTAQFIDMVLEQTSDQNNTISLKRIDIGLGNE